VPAYLGRWWSPASVCYPKDIPPPPDLRLEVEKNDIRVLIAGTSDPIAHLRDRVPGKIIDEYRDFRAELYHLAEHFFVLRLWFFWLWRPNYAFLRRVKKSLSTGTEIPFDIQMFSQELPDAERFDLVIDSRKETQYRVPYVATDTHWREVWTRPVYPREPVEAQLGIWSWAVLKSRLFKSRLEKRSYNRYIDWLVGPKLEDSLANLDKQRANNGIKVHQPSEKVRRWLLHEEAKHVGAGIVAHVPIFVNCEAPEPESISSDPRRG
jgi:hypothetical protein